MKRMDSMALVNELFLFHGEWVDKIDADNLYGYEWAIYTITTA